MSINYAKRLGALKPSPTLAFNAKAKALAAKGNTIINLSVGEPDYKPDSSIVERCQTALGEGRLRYSTPGGSLALREAIAAKLKRENNLDYAPSAICVGHGVKELLYHLCLAVLDEGDKVLIPLPYWVSYPEQVGLAQATSIFIPGPRLSAEALEQSIDATTKVLILNSPNNPAGYVLSAKELEKIADTLVKHPHVMIWSDEIYEYLCPQHLSILNICPELRSRTVLLNGLSKGSAMTGFRVGYAVHEDIAPVLSSLVSQSSTCLAPFIEEAAITALNGGFELMQSKLAVLEKRRSLCQELLDKRFLFLEGAFYAMIPLGDSIDALSFCEDLLEKRGVAVIAGDVFGMPHYVRLSYATSEADLRAGIKALLEHIAEWEKC
jgi:aspartate aminotransferase